MNLLSRLENGLSKSSPDVTEVFYFWPDLALLAIKNGRCSVMLFGTLLGEARLAVNLVMVCIYQFNKNIQQRKC